jgi:predicted Ser/Thr protein kinase
MLKIWQLILKYGNKFFTSHGNIIDYESGDMNRLDNKLSSFLNESNDTIKETLKRMLEIDTAKRAHIDELTKIFSI